MCYRLSFDVEQRKISYLSIFRGKQWHRHYKIVKPAWLIAKTFLEVYCCLLYVFVAKQLINKGTCESWKLLRKEMKFKINYKTELNWLVQHSYKLLQLPPFWTLWFSAPSNCRWLSIDQWLKCSWSPMFHLTPKNSFFLSKFTDCRDSIEVNEVWNP